MKSFFSGRLTVAALLLSSSTSVFASELRVVELIQPSPPQCPLKLSLQLPSFDPLTHVENEILINAASAPPIKLTSTWCSAAGLGQSGISCDFASQMFAGSSEHQIRLEGLKNLAGYGSLTYHVQPKNRPAMDCRYQIPNILPSPRWWEKPCWPARKDLWDDFTKRECPELAGLCDNGGKPIVLSLQNGKLNPILSNFRWLESQVGKCDESGCSPTYEIYRASTGQSLQVNSLRGDSYEGFFVNPNPGSPGGRFCRYNLMRFPLISPMQIRQWSQNTGAHK